jgi:beta-aspartyl-peptidase (threonine type)
MKSLAFLIRVLALFTVMLIIFSFETEVDKKYAIVIHGGAGNISPDNISPEMQLKYKADLKKAINAAEDILKNGGSSLDAVEAAIIILEDSPLFNAGKGAVFTNKEEIELDASIMDGESLNAGAVTGVKTVKNPIKLARKIMSNSNHVMLSGSGAEEFAKINKLEMVENSYFFTKKRMEALRKVKEKKEVKKHGTVGAVALDMNGNLAAATSTGGMTNKKYGRIGDSPIIGAGTYADNNGCAVSCTGHGEYFIINAVAYDLNAQIKYKNIDLQTAANNIIHDKLKKQNASGGLIAIDKNANISMTFNTSGMFRAYKYPDSEVVVEMLE